MNKEFLPYSLALELKELGFDEKVLARYSNYNDSKSLFYSNSSIFNDSTIAAPLYQQAFRWFREKGFISSIMYDNFYNMYDFTIDGESHFVSVAFTTYEEAELACLKKLIEIVKNK